MSGSAREPEPDRSAPVWNNLNADEKWLDSELCHRQMLRALPVAIFSCDAEGRITFYNLAAAKLWGRVPELNQDRWFESWQLFAPDGKPLPPSLCPMGRALREGRAVRDEVILVQQPDGTRIRVLPFSEPIRNLAGAVVGAMHTLVEIPPHALS